MNVHEEISNPEVNVPNIHYLQIASKADVYGYFYELTSM